MAKRFDGRKIPDKKKYAISIYFSYGISRELTIEAEDEKEARSIAYNIETDWDTGDLDYQDSEIDVCYEVKD